MSLRGLCAQECLTKVKQFGIIRKIVNVEVLELARYLVCYTLAEAARMLSVSRQRIHQLVEEGQLGVVRVHSRRYVSGPSLERYIVEVMDRAQRDKRIRIRIRGGGK